jgi:hypothetical protein
MKQESDELQPLLVQLVFGGPATPFLVLADWLQSRGDPWGELIALQCAHEREDDRERRIELDRLVDERARALIPCFERPGRIVRVVRGFVREVQLDADLEFARDLPALFAWPGARIASTVIVGLDDALVDTVCQTRGLAACTRLAFVDHVLSDARIARLRLAFPSATFHSRARGRDRKHKMWKLYGMGNSWLDALDECD